jgi:DNA polymerase-1
VPAPLLLVDVPWLLYRSFFALPSSITDGDGHPVNALLGTANAILTQVDPASAAPVPRAVVACTGAEEAAYRVQLYPPYHAHRDPMPDALAWQWTRAPALLEGLGWTVAGSEQLEADDVMFSLARAEEERGGRALLLTGDRDLYGAVSEQVAVIELKKGPPARGRSELGPAQVRERYGVEPAQMADLIALRGDPSDGIPGAPGVGAKTAAELLRTHGTLEHVLQVAGADTDDDAAAAVRATEHMRPRLAATLREHAELLRTFKHIATLQRIEVSLPPDRPTDAAGGAQVAEAMGMRRLAERLRALAPTA